MPLLSRTLAFSRVTAIASTRPVHAAFAWMHGNPQTILNWQRNLCAIPAPPFGEAERGQWMAERFREIGLKQVTTDEAGNVLGYLPTRDLGEGHSGPIVLLSAHLDTVFPP